MSSDRISEQRVWEWRDYFTDRALSDGEKDENAGKVREFSCDPKGSWARGKAGRSFDVMVKGAPTSLEELEDFVPWGESEDEYDSDFFAYGIRYRSDSRYYCSCSQGEQGTRCRHLASLMIHWEKAHGPFIFTETEEQYKARLEREAERERQRREEERKERERKRKEAEKKAKQAHAVKVSGLIEAHVPTVPKDIHFSPDEILKGSELSSNQYEAEIAQPLWDNAKDAEADLSIVYNDLGEQELKVDGRYGGESIKMRLGAKSIQEMSCSCGRAHSRRAYYQYYSVRTEPGLMCGHAMPFYAWLWKRLIVENPGDDTDQRANRLLNLLTGGARLKEIIEEVSDKSVKKDDIVLVPRITLEKDSRNPQLSFDLFLPEGKSYLLKNFETLVSAVRDGRSFTVAKNTEIDFSSHAFTDDSQKWYDFILSRVRAINVVNQKLNRGYYYTYRELSTGSTIPLEGSDLDIVYDMTQGTWLNYQYGTRREVTQVQVKAARARATFSLSPLKGKNRRLRGVVLSGDLPQMMKGNQAQYILDRTQFGRVDEDELEMFLPYQDIADQEGHFSCVIGLKKLPEFYFRVLPELRSSDQIELVDEVGELRSGILPPEPVFTFYISMEGNRLTCRSQVTYEDTSLWLHADGPLSGEVSLAVRDRDQEKRVMKAEEHFFPHKDEEKGGVWIENEDENLIRILTDGVSVLSKFGEVKGDAAFKKVEIRPVPVPRVSVEIEGGLLDLSIQTRDLTEDELLSLLRGYQEKKKWIRLRNGSFIDLRQAEGLEELETLADEMRLSLEDMVKHGVKLPKYRALYIDRMLESHDELAASRDKHFKGLIRSFQTIKDSDFEVSEGLENIMRPYQVYGYRWLSTLSQAGFGGILADEMGLGKTLQMLSLLLALKEAGETKASLVVCPASLVYNWKEEASRFTPSLRTELLAGNLSQRKALMQALRAGQGVDLYVTSYDLLKRDITIYNGIVFSSVILDEAQFIKNQKAAVSKAVKVLQAEHRYALTGTPIENRLSELWSIFDFLMPGFLYSSSEFVNRFETPIMKKKDQAATMQLSRMTEPFILRRKKEDVLKDLPEKLEEVQSTAMADEQRRLYDAQVVHMKELLNASADTGEDKMRILAEITRLRQICCDPSLIFENYRGESAKREACLELILRAIDGGHRMLVFSQFTSMLSLLQEDLKKASVSFYTITGSTSKEERSRLVKAFNSGDVPVFLISLKAGGTGLNLTGADVVIHYDPWWNLAVQNQATDRAHRIGQTRQVTVIKLITANSIEEKILQLQEAKKDLADAIIGGQSNSLMSMSREELMELLG